MSLVTGSPPAEVAAFEATDDLRERVKIIAGAQRRVLTEMRTDQVANSWQRLVDRLESSGKKLSVWRRLVALARGQNKKPSSEDEFTTMSRFEQAALASVIDGSALMDPWRRDLHLQAFDSWLLPELELRQLSLRELEEVAARLPHNLPAVLAPQAAAVCPQLWRWLRDAHAVG
jgi:hypothetical protein